MVLSVREAIEMSTKMLQNPMNGISFLDQDVSNHNLCMSILPIKRLEKI